MLFNEMVWNGDNNKKHSVVQVGFEKEDIQKAIDIANKKLPYINVNSPGGIKRNNTIIKNRIIAGKLADHAVKYLLLEKINANNLNFTISEYDETRNDNFNNADLYDLQIVKNGTSDIEVRSSFCYKLRDYKTIIKKLSIYGWYVSRSKPIETPRDFYWQFIYYLFPDGIPDSENYANVPTFENQLKQEMLTGYIVGGATQEMLNSGVIRSDQDGAFYQSISPICSGMDVNQILMATLDNS